MIGDVALAVALFTATLVVYEGFRALQARARRAWLNPLLLTFVTVGLALRALHVPLAVYREATRPLSWLVGPSVVALAYVLDARLDELRARARAVAASLSLGAVSGAFTAVLVARGLGASRVVIASLAPKSATTAIAAPVAARLGGDPSLAAVVVVLVGVLGALIGPALLRALGVRDRHAFGLAMGAAAHIVGTARARDEGDTEEGASAAAMVVHGVLTALLAWVAVRVAGP